jgi:hypothetical protein
MAASTGFQSPAASFAEDGELVCPVRELVNKKAMTKAVSVFPMWRGKFLLGHFLRIFLFSFLNSQPRPLELLLSCYREDSR